MWLGPSVGLSDYQGRSHLEELLLQGKAPDAINSGTQDRHILFRRTGKAGLRRGTGYPWAFSCLIDQGPVGNLELKIGSGPQGRGR
ncbi:MAG TPA: hypothetical protein VH682_16880 [Gemmataceae bacterium]